MKIPNFLYHVTLILVLSTIVLFFRDDTKEDVFVHQVSISSHNKLFLERKTSDFIVHWLNCLEVMHLVVKNGNYSITKQKKNPQYSQE